MQYQHMGYGIKGFYKIASFSRKLEAIMKTEAKKKLDAILFWDQHGIKATTDAFGVKQSTLYRWRKRYTEQGLSGLHDQSKAPRNRRCRDWSPRIVQRIRQLRITYPNMGNEKLYCLLEPWCCEQNLDCPKPRTIARIIADAPDRMRAAPRANAHIRKRARSKPRQRLGKGFKAQFSGHCVAVDTVVRFWNRTRYYLFTAVDQHSRFALSVATTHASSKRAADFLRLVQTLSPYPIVKVLSDNGGEFRGAFDALCESEGIEHCYTYPGCPKMNAFNERFNRTIQEEFVEYHEDYVGVNLGQFNTLLFEYLYRYNAKRPHHSLGLKTPVQKLASNGNDFSNMWWHHTLPCILLCYRLEYSALYKQVEH